MSEAVPERLKTAAIMQLVSGLINVFVMTWIASFTLGLAGSICTLGFGGQFCGFLACFLAPIGLFEIVAGAMGMTNPRDGARVMRIASFVEMASLLAGGIPSAIIGFLVLQWMGEPEVAAYLESEPLP